MEYTLEINLKIDWEFTEAEPTAHDSPGYDAHISITKVTALIGKSEFELPKKLEEKLVEELEADEEIMNKLWEEYGNQNRGRDE